MAKSWRKSEVGTLSRAPKDTSKEPKDAKLVWRPGPRAFRFELASARLMRLMRLMRLRVLCKIPPQV